MSWILASTDISSKIKGAAMGPRAIRRRLSQGPEPSSPILEISQENSNFFVELEGILRSQRQPFNLIGGEHLLTYFGFKESNRRQGTRKLVLFDAHHDAYADPMLSHYSFVHHLVQQFQAEALVVGARYQLDRIDLRVRTTSGNKSSDSILSEIRTFLGGESFYFSIDLDVLEPTDFSAVSFPVMGGLSGEKLLSLAEACLKMRPVAADLMELNPERIRPAEESLLDRLLSLYRFRLV